jgi:hypothetical protein
MKEAYKSQTLAWNYAKRLGYPSDVTILFDISPFIYSYFNCMEDLFYHFDQILSERPKHKSLIKTYSYLIFNERDYEKVIDLINRNAPDLDVDDYGMLILANYYLKRFREALKLLQENESLLTKEQPEKVVLIFCIGSELAREQMDDELAEKYIKIVKGYDSGYASLLVFDFMRKANSDPSKRAIYTNDLYDEYIKLGKPITIAEQLFIYLDSKELTSAKQIIDLSKNLLSSHELNQQDYFQLAQAFITTSKFDEALEIAEKNIDKGIFDPDWHIIKVICLQNMVKLGLAFKEIKDSLSENSHSREHLKLYVKCCLDFGLISEVEEVLIDLLSI